MCREERRLIRVQDLHEDELRDSREYVARLGDFVKSLEGGLLKQMGATTETTRPGDTIF